MGVTVLQYARPSLQNNHLLLHLTEQARDLMELKVKIEDRDIEAVERAIIKVKLQLDNK